MTTSRLTTKSWGWTWLEFNFFVLSSEKNYFWWARKAKTFLDSSAKPKYKLPKGSDFKQNCRPGPNNFLQHRKKINPLCNCSCVIMIVVNNEVTRRLNIEL